MGLIWRSGSLSISGPVRARITTELTERLQAEVAIDHIELDVLPRPQLQLHGLRLEFVDGTVLDVPLVSLALTFKGLLVGRPEMVRIRCEKPEVRIVLRRQEPEAGNRTAEARHKEFVQLIESALKFTPLYRVTVHDGTVTITAPDGSLLALEKVAVKAAVTLQGLRLSASCATALWERLKIKISYHDPEATLELDARDIDTAKSIRVLKAFAEEDFPVFDIMQSLRGIHQILFRSRSLFPVFPILWQSAVISGRGSFEDMSLACRTWVLTCVSWRAALSWTTALLRLPGSARVAGNHAYRRRLFNWTGHGVLSRH